MTTAALSGHHFSFPALGCRWTITTAAGLTTALTHEIANRIDRFDRCYSRFRADSMISRFAVAERGTTVVFPPDATVLFDIFDRLYAVTDGAIDPLVGADLERLGYDANYSLAPRAETRPPGIAPDWRRDVYRRGHTITTRRALVLDVGAAGKGYLVDLVSAMLQQAGHDDFVVDASGDLRHTGQDALRIGLEDPRDPTRVIGVTNLANAALAASAPHRRCWGPGLHHLLDGRTGRPTNTLTASWVVADDALTADALATALFVVDSRALHRAFDFTHVRLWPGGRADRSQDFDGELFVTPAPGSRVPHETHD